ncbi:MAG: excinuclease ABC subunit UvrB [Nanoarchaeota archaeon]
MPFNLITNLCPAGGQPDAIKKIVHGFLTSGFDNQTLLGITGSGKTFVTAHVIAHLGKPTLVLAHNKTLAAQLYQELVLLFPHNRVEYFVSYYDYYQPESYIASTDTYIEKDAQRNEKIERMRLKATASLLSRDDVIVVSSISCIYGLGNPVDFLELSYTFKIGEHVSRRALIDMLTDMQYDRNDAVLEPGRFRVRGDVIDVIPGYDEHMIRIELLDDTIESIKELHHVDHSVLQSFLVFRIFPAKHFVTPASKTAVAINGILTELSSTLPSLGQIEALRLQKRTMYDIEMIKEIGYCSGIENYSRFFDGRNPGEPPFTLLDYFPKDFLLVIDESHQTIPQAHGMYKGDYARKKSLVENGFRLPSAYDNRPLRFEEFETRFPKTLFVSATPAEYELRVSEQVVDLIIRPTGLLDPCVELRPTKNQIPDLVMEIKSTTNASWRVLVTTLTKKMAQDLANYLSIQGIAVRYLHSDIDTIERTEIIRQLRLKEFDVLVGINLLREGIDIPEVALVAILDADKEGFLRNTRSLIQIIGRAARNANGRVIMYADNMTDSITEAIKITHNRREQQIKFNKEHGIVPKTITKSIQEAKTDVKTTLHIPKAQIPRHLIELEAQMRVAAEQLDFELAIQLRDQIKKLQQQVS